MISESTSTSIVYSAIVIIAFIAIILLAYGIYWILRNPFHYPYFIHEFDVSRKRNVDIDNYIDGFLCSESNWNAIENHKAAIERWKTDSERYLQTCRLRNRRIRQYQDALDDEHAFRFMTYRDQTRYKQQNYVKTSYKVSVQDSEKDVNWAWLSARHQRLAEINFETTLKDYHSKTQRKLMTKALRKQIMERDNYTCQMCGRYMPDEVGLQIDHIIPVAKGGKTVPSNLRVLCNKCNGRKGAR